MLEVPLSSHRTLHLQTEKTNLNHSIHLHAASVEYFRIKINMHVEAGGPSRRAGRAGSAAGEQQRRMRGETGTLHKPPGDRSSFWMPCWLANTDTEVIRCFYRLLLFTPRSVKAI